MSPRDFIEVEVACAGPDVQHLIRLRVAEGCTVLEAVRRSGVLERCGMKEADIHALGIFGRCVGPDRVLREGDRVELYRPLRRSPGQARRHRARQRD